MMLHVRHIKNEIIRNLHKKVNEIDKTLRCKEIFFNKKIQTYCGVKLHNGYVFLFNENKELTYPRGIHGSTLKQIYLQIKNNEVHGFVTVGDQRLKIKLKKHF